MMFIQGLILDSAFDDRGLPLRSQTYCYGQRESCKFVLLTSDIGDFKFCIAVTYVGKIMYKMLLMTGMYLRDQW